MLMIAETTSEVGEWRVVDTFCDVNGKCKNCIGGCFSDRFYVHATLCRTDHNRSVVTTVHKNCEILFAGEIDAFADKNFVARLAGGSCLFCDQVAADHFGSQSTGLLRV